jgi:DNA-binding NarL/FixJ family response regulator
MSDQTHRQNNLKPVQLVIIDEHPAVRRALLIRLGSAPEVQVMSVDTSLEEALTHARELQPDVFLLGLRSTRRQSAFVLGQIVQQLAQLGVGVIALTSYVDVVERDQLLQAGARRYLLKNIDSKLLVAEIEAVAEECNAAEDRQE